LKAESVEESNWQSFSDEFVSRFIGAAIWIIDNLAEQAIDLWLTLRNLPAELEMSAAHPTAIEARSKALNDFDWRDSNGSPIKDLPFSLHYQNGPSEAWPPRH
ncbi:hypothetical protein, partial [Acinetobacter baumannii]|uniref:hypothetical protein n=1 Tax=Acinetobacter baumannii TaxID=470 RepID=UPI001BB46BCC